jgi:recombinational DNA repair protein (RecF pathway)
LGRVVIQRCDVIKSTPWTESKSILTLISKERCVFSARFKHESPFPDDTPKAKQLKGLGKEKHPGLFQSLAASIEFHPEGLHKLRSFDVEDPSPSDRLPRAYTGLCLLSRMLQKTVGENQGDPQPFGLWSRHRSGQFDRPHWLNILADLHWCLGTWASVEQCENCGKTTNEIRFFAGHLACPDCQHEPHALSVPQQQWLQQHHRSPSDLAMSSKDIKLLARFFWQRLPDHLHSDRLFRRLANLHFRQLH